MPRFTIALLSGGRSSEREISLAGGKEIARAIDPDKYQLRQYDPRDDLAQLVQDADQLDLAFVLLHGPYGEDGTIQGLLDLLGIPYQCSGVLGSALALNKLATKRIYQQAGLPTPPYRVLPRTETDPADARTYASPAEQLGFPLVVKPACGGSSVGMSLVTAPRHLGEALRQAFQYDTTVLLEAYIDGLELTGGILGNDRLEALPVVEIVPDQQYDFFNYEAKYTTGATREVCPARINAQLTERVQEYARLAHGQLFCRGCSRTDMILQKERLYVLETNTIPGMVPTSLLPLAARTAGLTFEDLVDRLIGLGLESAGLQKT